MQYFLGHLSTEVLSNASAVQCLAGGGRQKAASAGKQQVVNNGPRVLQSGRNGPRLASELGLKAKTVLSPFQGDI